MKVKPYYTGRIIKSSVIHLFLIMVAFTCLFPLFWMVRSSLMSNNTIFVDKSLIPHKINIHNYYLAWTQGNFGAYFLNSVFYTVCVVLGVILVSSLAAYAFSRLQFPGRNIFFFIFLAAMMIPLPGSFVPLYVLMTKFHLVNTRIGYILCMVNVKLSLSIYLFKTFFDTMPPALEDAARMDGCSKLGIWRHVALPLAKPAIAVVAILTTLEVWNEYILATLLLNDQALMPLQRGLMVFQGTHLTDYALLMAGLTIAVAPILIVYLFLQKYIIKGISSGAIVG